MGSDLFAPLTQPPTHASSFFSFLDSGTAWLGFQMPLRTPDKDLGCSLRPTSELELGLGTRPSSNYVERETKAKGTQIWLK